MPSKLSTGVGNSPNTQLPKLKLRRVPTFFRIFERWSSRLECTAPPATTTCFAFTVKVLPSLREQVTDRARVPSLITRSALQSLTSMAPALSARGMKVKSTDIFFSYLQPLVQKPQPMQSFIL